jgi:hypothetical protein
MLANLAKRLPSLALAFAILLSLAAAPAHAAATTYHVRMPSAPSPITPVAYYNYFWPNLVDIYGITYTYWGNSGGVDYWIDDYWGDVWWGIGIRYFSNGYVLGWLYDGTYGWDGGVQQFGY